MARQEWQRARVVGIASLAVLAVSAATYTLTELQTRHLVGERLAVAVGASLVIGLATLGIPTTRAPAQRGKEDPAAPQQRARGRVLISYIAADVAWAVWVQALLRAAGCAAELQGWRFMPTEDLDARRRDATAAGERILVIQSEAFCRSPYGVRWLGLLVSARATARRVALLQVEPCASPPHVPRVTEAVDGLEPLHARQVVLQAIRRLGVAVCVDEAMAVELPRFPGGGPDISLRTPAPRADFAGRTAELDTICGAVLNRNAEAGIQAFAICGLGGVGKTALAAEYAHRFRSRYEVMCWVHAEQASSIAADLAGLAAAAGITETSAQEEMIRSLWQELGKRGRWLIIFDNANTYADVRPFWPVSGSGGVLVTSRRKEDWQALGQQRILELDVLSMADAVLLVQKRADWVRAEDAAGLADKLGRLALALVQASSYIARTKISVTEYLSRLERYNAEVLTRFPPDDYPDTVKTTWSMSVSQAEREVPGCRQLLAMCAYLGPDRIPRTLFPDHAGLLPAQLRALVTKRLAYDDALGELSGYSMITMDAESMSIHRMVQYATRAQMPLRQQRAWASGAVRLLDEAFPADPRPADMWPVCKQLVPHVQAAARYAQDLAVEEERAGRILHQAGDYLTERAEYGQALGYLTSAQRIRERQGDLGGLAETLARMSFAHYCRAELGMAEETIAVAAELRERVLGPHHPLFAGDLTHYGRVVQELARIGEAIEHMTKAVAILETAYGPDDPGICETLDYLGVAQWRNGNLKAARSTLERAVRIRFEEFGNSRPETAYSRRMLAMIALAQRDLGVAHTEVDQAIETFTTTYGWDYVEALTARQIHGDILLAEGEVKAALDELRAVLAARISLLGDDHPSVAGSRRRVGAALRELGQQAEALAELEAARKVFQDKYGTNHPYVAEVLVELGPVLHRLHRDQEAAECLNRAEVIVEQAYGPDHPALIAILENQAQLSRRDRDRLASRADRIRRVSGVMGDGKAS